MLRRFAPVVLLVLALGVPSFPAADALAADKLVVWWNKGYYPEEDAAMQKIVKEFEATHKAEVDLSFTAQEDLLKKITAALIAHRVPDVAFCFYNDWQVVPKFGWDDQLADVSDVIQALRPRYNEKLLPVAFVLNHWRPGRAGALRMGMEHGAWCVGCCWALMASLFALGDAHPLLARSVARGRDGGRPGQGPDEVG